MRLLQGYHTKKLQKRKGREKKGERKVEWLCTCRRKYKIFTVEKLRSGGENG
jgi:hypothetical protein